MFSVFASVSITVCFVIAFGSRRCFGYLLWGPPHILGIRFVVHNMVWGILFKKQIAASNSQQLDNSKTFRKPYLNIITYYKP